MATLTTTTHKGASMTTPHPMSPPAATATPTRVPLVGRAVEFNWRRTFTMWIFMIQYVHLACYLWPVIVPESSHGLVSLATQDLNMSPALMASLFLIGIGISWRGVRPRWWLLPMLGGQLTLSTLAVAYAIKGQVTWSQVAGHGGLFLLCLCAIVSMIQRETHAVWRLRTWQIEAQSFLIPIIGATLCLYGVSLATRTDTGIAVFIQGQFGAPLIALLVFFFCVAGGVAVQNHISASRLFVCLIPQAVYAAMAISLLGSDNDVSLAGIIVHMLFTITAMFVVLIQTKEYALSIVRQRRETHT